MSVQNGKDGDFFVTFNAGEYVYREGDEGDSMYIIEDGMVDIVQEGEAEERKVSQLEVGDFFGEMSLLDDQPREASARVVSETQLLRIDKSTFDQMLRQNPEIAIRILRKLARRLRTLSAMHEASPAPAAPPQAAAPAAVSAPAPAADSAPRRAFHLVSEATGEVLPLPDKAEITVGRPDPVTGTVPDVDLTTEDTKRSVSRRHAKIFRRAEGFFVSEEIGAANGTFVNNERIPSGVAVPLTENDVVSFGRVTMTFRGA